MGDTQVGMKLMRRGAIVEIRENLRVNGFAFDVEMLSMLIANGQNIIYLPVTIRKNGEVSTVSSRDMLRMLVDVLTIKMSYVFSKVESSKNSFLYSIMDR